MNLKQMFVTLLVVGIILNIFIWADNMELVNDPCGKCVKANPIKKFCLLQKKQIINVTDGESKVYLGIPKPINP